MDHSPWRYPPNGQSDPFESIYGLGLDPKTVSEVDDPYDHWGLYVIPGVGAAWGVGDQFRTVFSFVPGRMYTMLAMILYAA